MTTKYGLPLADADDIFDIFQSLGIVKWKMSESPMLVSDYLKKGLSLAEEVDLKYLLREEVATFIDPKGNFFKGFRFAGHYDGTVVFTLLPGNLVVVCAEFMHGCEDVVLELPGGMLETGEDPASRAKKEFEDETGVILKNVIPLGLKGTTYFSRRLNSRCYAFLGVVPDPVIIGKQKLDDSEYLEVVLVHLKDWLKLIDKEKVDCKSIIATFKALRKLGLIKT